MHIYRIVQEAVSNVIRHSGATAMTINYSRSDRRLKVSVIDNGHGVRRHHGKVGGIGMSSMRSRAAYIGAILRIATPATGGTRVELSLPMPGRPRP